MMNEKSITDIFAWDKKIATLLDYKGKIYFEATDSDTLTYTVPGGTATCAFDIVGGTLVKKTCAEATGLNHL